MNIMRLLQNTKLQKDKFFLCSRHVKKFVKSKRMYVLDVAVQKNKLVIG